MGKGGKNKAKKAPEPADDDALLDAAIAANKQQMEKLAIDKKEADAKAAAEAPPPLTKQQIIEKMNELPTFCIVDDKKQFVPIRIRGEGSAESDAESCVFFTETNDAKSSLAQARRQRPDERLDIAAFPLGNAFALEQGWAEAQARAPFRLQASAEVVRQLRPMLTKQLQQQQMALDRPFPVYMCEELTSEHVMPVFLSSADMQDTWEQAIKAAGKTAPPPSRVTVMDLRILVKHMEAPGEDWSILRFIGDQRAFDLANQGHVFGKADADEPPPLTSETPPAGVPQEAGEAAT